MRFSQTIVCVLASCASPLGKPDRVLSNKAGLVEVRATWVYGGDGIGHPAPCDQLEPGDPDCCVLSCVDPSGFRAACGIKGECVDYACPLLDGGWYKPGVCEARDVGPEAPVPTVAR